MRARIAPVLAIGWPAGQTASTLHPAFAKAIASRAAGYQRPVVAIRTFGFTVGGTSVPLRALLRMCVVDSAENVRAIA